MSATVGGGTFAASGTGTSLSILGFASTEFWAIAIGARAEGSPGGTAWAEAVTGVSMVVAARRARNVPSASEKPCRFITRLLGYPCF